MQAQSVDIKKLGIVNNREKLTEGKTLFFDNDVEFFFSFWTLSRIAKSKRRGLLLLCVSNNCKASSRCFYNLLDSRCLLNPFTFQLENSH